MSRWSPIGLVVAALALGASPVAALIERLSDRDIANAINLASTGETARTLFHAPYILPLETATVERLEVITEYRRFVLAAEEQLRQGNWMLGRGGFDQKGRTLKDRLRPYAGQVSVRATLRFHPHNAYVTLPPFDIMLGEPTLVAQQAIRTPHVTPAPDDGKSRDFIYGATIETMFEAIAIGDRTVPVRIVSDGAELARATMDFSRIQ